MKKVSFILPCYGSENTIAEVVSQIDAAMQSLPYAHEIVLVEDSSFDSVGSVIDALAKTNQHVVGLHLAKNFGQHAAIMAGIRNADPKSDIYIFADDDLQTPLNEVSKLIAPLETDYDVVYAQYTEKKHEWYRNIFSKINDVMAQILIGKPKELYISSFFACRNYVVEEIKKYNNPYPYLYGLVFRTCNRITNMPVSHKERQSGKSGYTFFKLFSLWMNGFTSFSVKPLRISSIMGFVISVIGFIMALYIVIRKLIVPETLLGYTSTLAVVLLLGGILLIMLGIVGEYIGRIYMCINNSPQYVVREANGREDEMANEEAKR